MRRPRIGPTAGGMPRRPSSSRPGSKFRSRLAKVSAGDLAVAGTAWAQRSGIKRVDVKLDDGEWTSAELGDEVNIDTWRQWKTGFSDVDTGLHTVTVRAIDQDGNVQTPKRRKSIPNSATGHHHIQFSVE